MKRILKPAFITVVYAAVVLIFCVILGFLKADTSSVLPSDRFVFKLLTGQSYIMELFPTVLITGYLIGLALMFGSKNVGAQKAFSREMAANFRIILVYAVIFTVFAFVANELGTVVNHSMQKKINKQRNYSEYVKYTESHMEDGRLNDARYYLRSAWELYPSSPEVQRLDRQLESLLTDSTEEKHALIKSEPAEENSIIEESQRESLHYLQAAQQAFREARYIDAHYFATLAASSAQKDDANWDKAMQLAAQAWNMLSVPEDSMVADSVALFSDKMRGYESLDRGDVIEAYNIYKQLHDVYDNDPEIAEYYAIAREKLENSYFYTDETSDLQAFESAMNVSFTLFRDDGSSTDFAISGVTVVPNASQMIQYLRNVEITEYDQFHQVVSELIVPYAKLTAEIVTTEKKTRYEPFLTLVSVDRNDSHNRLYPEYLYNSTGAPVPSYMHLPMSYSDFNLICKASSSAKGEGLTIMQLYTFARSAEQFGFTGEVFFTAFLHRVLFPLNIMLLLVLVALSGFRYRLLPGRVFKFKWIVLFPLLTVIFFPVMNAIMYFFDTINLVGYNSFGSDFFLIAVIVQLVFLAWCCFLFISARGE